MLVLRNTLIMMILVALCGSLAYIWLSCRGELQNKAVSRLDAALFVIMVICFGLFVCGLMFMSTHWTRT